MIIAIGLHAGLAALNWRLATHCQQTNNQFGYYVNLLASAVNGAVVAHYIF
jgi:hypothetical protein